MEENNIIQDIPQADRFNKDNFTGNDVELDTYDRMPVDNFGIQCLKSMGWNEQRGIGKRQKVVELVQPKPRNHRQGLSADVIPSSLDKKKEARDRREAIKDITGKNIKKQDSNKFGLVKGSEVEILEGQHQGFSGIIVSVDEERRECFIELKNGSQVRVGVFDIEDKKVAEKRRIEKKSKKIKKQKSRSNSNSSDSDSDNKKKKKKKGKKDKKKKEKKDKKDKKLKWVVPNIRVKVVDKQFEEFYTKKVIVQDILDQYSFSCLAESGQYIENLKEKHIQTVLPPLEGEVIVIKGDHKGELAYLKVRDKKNNTVMIQIKEGEHEFYQCTQDDVCEYVSQR